MRPIKLPIEWTLALAFFWLVLVAGLSLTSVGFGSSHLAYYERYARAIGAGHLYLQEAQTCDWDLSLHNGKCYSYWGIVPALFHWLLPFVSDRVMTLLASTAAVFFLLRTCLSLSGISDDDRGRAMPLLLFLTFMTGLPAMALVARVYEESIAFGAAFGLAGIYTLLPVLGGSASARRTVAAVALLTVAGLARTPWLGVAFLGCGYLLIRQISQRQLARLAWTAAPLAVGVGFQLWLNHARFGSVFELGYAAQTSNQQFLAQGHSPLSPHNLLGNLFAYLVTSLPPLANPLTSTTKLPDLPFLPITKAFMEGRAFQELGLALLVTMPSLVLCVPLLREPGEPRRKALTIAAVALPPSLAVLQIAGCIYRYQLEAVLPLLLVAVPLLLRSPRFLRLHWLALFFGAPVCALNTLWIVKVICRDWGYC